MLLFLGVFYAYPLAAMLSRSVHDDTGWTIGVYPALIGGGMFWRVLWITEQISAIVTAACLLLAYPLAYWLARLRPAAANLAVVLALAPFWTSILVRTYAWMALLGRRGVVNGRIAAIQAAGALVEIVWHNQLLRTDAWANPKEAANAGNARKLTALITMAAPQARLSSLIAYGFVNNEAAKLLPPERLKLQQPKSDRLAPKVLALVAQWRSYHLVGREVRLSKNTVAGIVRRNKAT